MAALRFRFVIEEEGNCFHSPNVFVRERIVIYPTLKSRRRHQWFAQTIIRPIILILLCSPCILASQPKTIPALKQWTDSPGQFKFTPSSRIVLDEGHAAELLQTAQTFSADLVNETGFAIPIVTAATPAAGDIFLSLGATDPAIGAEGYLLAVGDYVEISGRRSSGVFYGTRTILQILRQTFFIGAGSAVDWPDYPERALMVDVGRKFFSMDFLRGHIRELAYLKLNYLHLHLSDVDLKGRYGFRLESLRHPEITSPQHYTRSDIQELLALAARYHVMIVPEIDLPAHATAILASHPELQLSGHPDKFDLGIPASYALVGDLLDEFLPVFPAPYWHTGADEYLQPSEYAQYPHLLSYAQVLYGPHANAPDIYIGFVNWIDGIVKARGKQLRAWSDVYGVTGAVNSPNRDVVIELWFTAITPQEALAEGHSISNSQYFALYYLLGVDGPANKINLYEDWQPNKQWVQSADLGTSPPTVIWAPDLPARVPGLLGGKFHVWCDYSDAETEDQVSTGITPYLRGLAQNSWGSPKLAPNFLAFQTIIDAIGHAPEFAPDFTLAPQSVSLAVPAGNAASFTLDVAPVLNFSQSVELACISSAPSSTCTVTPASVTLDGAHSVPIKVSLRTNSPIAPFQDTSIRMLSWWFGVVGVLLPVTLRKVRYWECRLAHFSLTVMLLILLAGLLASAGCGGGSSTPVPPLVNSTPGGSYYLQVSGRSGITHHAIALSVTVQ